MSMLQRLHFDVKREVYDFIMFLDTVKSLERYGNFATRW